MRTVAADQFRLHFNPRGSVLDAARECEAEVFFEAYGNTRTELAEEYGPYDASSIFVAVTGDDGAAVAAARLILPGSAGLKSVNDASRPPWNVDGIRSAQAAGIDLAATWDIATIGVRKYVARPGLLSAALYHGIIAGGRANGCRSIVMIMDERARRLLSAVGLATRPLPGTSAGEYLGSPASTPLWAHSDAIFYGQREINPEAHRLIGLGVGLDGIALPPASDYQLAGDRVAAEGVLEVA